MAMPETDVLVADDARACPCRRCPRQRSSSSRARSRAPCTTRPGDEVGEARPFRHESRARCSLRIRRLTSSSFAGTGWTLVAVGTARLATMFSTSLAAAPRSGVTTPSPAPDPGAVDSTVGTTAGPGTAATAAGRPPPASAPAAAKPAGPLDASSSSSACAVSAAVGADVKKSRQLSDTDCGSVW